MSNELIARLSYVVENPSAWEGAFDQRISDMIAEAIAALSAQPSGVVKGLEWDDKQGTYASFEFGPETIFYSVYLVDEKLNAWSVETGVIGSSHNSTEVHKCIGKDAAKSAAEAYHASRVAALSRPASAEGGEPVAWVVQLLYDREADRWSGEMLTDHLPEGCDDTFRVLRPLYASPVPASGAPEPAPAGEVEQIARIIRENLSGPTTTDQDIKAAHEADLVRTAESIAALLASPVPAGDMERAVEASDGVALIAAERRRHPDEEGWTPEHDDAHDGGEMAHAGAFYALATAELRERIGWPWEMSWFKSTNRIRDLTKAGALIAAEIDRLLRLPASPTPQEPDSEVKP